MSDFDYKKHLITLKGNKEYLPANARIAWFRSEHPDWGIVTEPMVPLMDTMLDKKFAIFKASIFNADGKLISTGTKCETRADFPDFMEKAETGAISRALAYCGYGTLQAMELDEGEDVSDAPEKAPTRPVEAPVGPKTGTRQSAHPAHVSGQRQNGKAPQNMDTMIADGGAEEEMTSEDPHAEDLWAEASGNFRDFVFAMGGLRIENDAQEATLVNRLLKRTGAAMAKRPTPQEYMDALKLYERYLKQKAEKDAADEQEAAIAKRGKEL